MTYQIVTINTDSETWYGMFKMDVSPASYFQSVYPLYTVSELFFRPVVPNPLEGIDRHEVHIIVCDYGLFIVGNEYPSPVSFEV